MINNAKLRAILADVAREVLSEPEPPGVVVVCHYRDGDGDPSPEVFTEAARGRRIGVRFMCPDNGRGARKALPWFHVIDPSGESWEWAPGLTA